MRGGGLRPSSRGQHTAARSKRRGKVNTADARVVKSASSNSIKEALEHMVHEKAVITTDGSRDNQKATEGKWHNIEYSEDGAIFVSSSGTLSP